MYCHSHQHLFIQMSPDFRWIDTKIHGRIHQWVKATKMKALWKMKSCVYEQFGRRRALEMRAWVLISSTLTADWGATSAIRALTALHFQWPIPILRFGYLIWALASEFFHILSLTLVSLDLLILEISNKNSWNLSYLFLKIILLYTIELVKGDFNTHRRF
jgi:hypothetical protein